ncbi:hypothetical protein BKP35_08970 [Anaerobacillus arseniciselenatis]|uniref:Uncharacterized protein n=1 Tax=Anaerobacillus arseniciselenatis TaxID=85682 RepID=A0A1S2LLU6_9BACI|nr:hypothetical protein [Anaerobacillus arseniciselenatis]OIJ13356.1 hypothetical protein BKP35_08970 [Anaerobacillus arseniciselenatis]
MNKRNVVEIVLHFDADKTVSYKTVLNEIKQCEELKKINANVNYLLTINELIELFDLSRAAFEQNIIENDKINTGVKHINVEGLNVSRTRIFIDAIDLIEYLIEHCNLTYWKKSEIKDNHFTLEALSKNDITREDVEYLAKSLFQGRLKSSKNIEGEYKRTRKMVRRLENIIDTVTFAFPGSQRQLRRFVLSPLEDDTQMEHYFKHYKSYENKIIRLKKD